MNLSFDCFFIVQAGPSRAHRPGAEGVERNEKCHDLGDPFERGQDCDRLIEMTMSL